MTSPAAHVPHSVSYGNPYNGYSYTLRTWLYDIAVFLFDVVFTIFFREIKVRGSFNVPPTGTPTILVCAPHANQFVDPSLVMSQVRKLGDNRSRQPCFVTAESSFKKKFISLFGKWTGGIPVARAQDNLKPVDSRIQIYLPDPINNPCLLKGRVVSDETVAPEFTRRFTAKALVGLPNYLGNAQIREIVDDETLLLEKPFKDTPKIQELLAKGTCFKYAHRIDNTEVFQNVFNHLHTKGCVGIFPEGGSHDRPSLLPIKAGVAIMALGAAAADPNMKISVVPCGLHYFHRNKFRSRAVLEFGEPIVVDGAMGQQYKESPREAVSTLLDKITQSLYAVTINSTDYDTLMTIQAARRLYQPVVTKENDGRLPLPLVVEMNRRLLAGYSQYKDDPRIVHLKSAVQHYNAQLYSLGLKDHQVMKLKPNGETLNSLITLISRLAQLSFFVILTLPGTILFTPIFITCHYYAKKKAEEGLKKSLVKLKGVDLLATWKLVVALVMAPSLYVTYSVFLVFLTSRHSNVMPFVWYPQTKYLSRLVLFVYYYILLVAATYASFKTGEIGMDIFKSLPPLFVSLVYPERKLQLLQQLRQQLSLEVTTVCNDLGPTVFPDFGNFASKQIETYQAEQDKPWTTSRSRSSSVHSMASQLSNALSKVNSRGSLSDIPILGEGLQGKDEDEDTIDIGDSTAKSSKISELVRKNWQEKED